MASGRFYFVSIEMLVVVGGRNFQSKSIDAIGMPMFTKTP